jgi:hypothetical protein
MKTPRPQEPSPRDQWDALQDHVWRAGAVSTLLLELFLWLELHTMTTEEPRYTYVRPQHLRFVVAIVVAELEKASTLVGEIEPSR